MNRYLSAIFASFLLSVSCNDCDDKEKNSSEVSWSPAKPSEGYDPIPIYNQPKNEHLYVMEVLKEKGKTSSIIGFTEPSDAKQKNNWVKKWTYDGKERGYIKVPAKGAIEVSAQWVSIPDSESDQKIGDGEIGLYINNEETPRKSFSVHNAKRVSNDRSFRYVYRFYAKDIEVDENDEIHFKQIKPNVTTVLNTVIYLKRKTDDKPAY